MTMTSIKELNTIQAEWMALSLEASEEEKQRVFNLMRKLPKSHITVSGDRSNANIYHQSSPDHATGFSMEYAKERARSYGYRVDVAWCGFEGKWVSI